MHLISDGNCLVKTIQRLRTAIFQWGLHNIQLETTTLLSSPKRVHLKSDGNCIARNSEPRPHHDPPRSVTIVFASALRFLIEKCIDIVFQSIAAKNEVLEFPHPNENFFSCGNSFELERVL